MVLPESGGCSPPSPSGSYAYVIDLGWPGTAKNHSLQKRCVFWSQLHKFEWDRPILSVAKCRPMTCSRFEHGSLSTNLTQADATQHKLKKCHATRPDFMATVRPADLYAYFLITFAPVTDCFKIKALYSRMFNLCRKWGSNIESLELMKFWFQL